VLFPSYIFIFLFAPITIAVYWLLRGNKLKLFWLTVTSYIFYGYWDWQNDYIGAKFAVLLLVSTVINYFAGLLIKAADGNPRRHKTVFIISVVVNLSIIGFFKYWMLIVDGINWIATKLGVGFIEQGGQVVGILPEWNIILPIGISFFTFHAMSYIIDTYRKDIEPTGDFIEFAAYLALFPQLIAGPIVRYIEIRDTLKNLPIKISAENLNLGFFYFSIGLIKKVLIADRIAAYIDPMLENMAYKELTPLTAWIAMIGFGLQLLFDFAGYSTMAIGLGHMMGFTFPWNFNSPYKAVSISDFWRRWHMSLSRWLRDYLYIPLGGRNNRAMALIVTMFLGGLWHGAAWVYVIWGLLHGLFLELHHRLKPYKWMPKNVIWARTGTFLLVTLLWVMFRAGSLTVNGQPHPHKLEAALDILGKMLDIPGLFRKPPEPIPLALIFFIVVGLVWAMFGMNSVEVVREKKLEPKMWWAVVLGVLMAVCILFLSQAGPFLYFQF